MKLNKTKILRILEKKNKGMSSYQARKEAGVSQRRVDQIWSEYQRTGEIPVVGARMGPPTKSITQAEVHVVKKVHEQYKVSAAPLEKLIFRDYQTHIPHNKIHKILLCEGLAKKGDKTVVRKKNWIRYERRHSLTAVHIDWHQRPNDGIWVFKVLDDASRALLAILERDSPTQEASIEGMKEALKYGPIKECISDHGSQFTSNNGGENNFKKFLDDNGIKQILCRIKHPQSNGKVERSFYTYERHRDSFPTAEAYQHWYNHIRPHMSLNFDELETPWQAFQRKMR
ncbi:transposase family protein [Candidatus Woesearchaeota archaeon]|nr:transposase family protein [Candidatus Woesearchaeota archaeon]